MTDLMTACLRAISAVVNEFSSVPAVGSVFIFVQ